MAARERAKSLPVMSVRDPRPPDGTLHRLARLLVSEIKLYNEEQVEAGRKNRDLYQRLKDEIERSRQMYEERVEPRIVRRTDYFYQELVRILAAGDARALGEMK
jgi:molybdopterin converting factor small subunit